MHLFLGAVDFCQRWSSRHNIYDLCIHQVRALNLILSNEFSFFGNANSKLIWNSVPFHFISFYFRRFNHTPVIMASGRELCYVLLTGVAGCYIMSFIILARPTVIRCACLRIGLGLCLSLCYSAIFVKTNRISRIFNCGVKAVSRPIYTSPISQIAICLCTWEFANTLFFWCMSVYVFFLLIFIQLVYFTTNSMCNRNLFRDFYLHPFIRFFFIECFLVILEHVLSVVWWWYWCGNLPHFMQPLHRFS